MSGFRDNCSSEARKTFPVYEEVEGLQLLPQSDEFSEKFPAAGRGANLVAVAGKNGVVRVFSVDGIHVDVPDQEADHTDKKKGKKKKRSTTSTDDGEQQRLTCRCVMTQDNASASHRAGYTALLLDRRRAGLIAVTADHNLVLLGSTAAGKSLGGSLGSLVTRRQIVGFNDEVIDLKSFPSGEGCGGVEGESWVAVATNSPQVRLFELGGFSCRLLDGHTDTVLALDVAPDG